MGGIIRGGFVWERDSLFLERWGGMDVWDGGLVWFFVLWLIGCWGWGC